MARLPYCLDSKAAIERKKINGKKRNRERRLNNDIDGKKDMKSEIVTYVYLNCSYLLARLHFLTIPEVAFVIPVIRFLTTAHNRRIQKCAVLLQM